MELKISVYDILKNSIADDSADGKKFFSQVIDMYKKEDVCNKIIVDFSNIEILNTAFLNDAVGQFFNKNIFNLDNCKVSLVNLKSQAMIDIVEDSVMQAKKKYAIMVPEETDNSEE